MKASRQINGEEIVSSLDQDSLSEDRRIVRDGHLADKIVIVDGQPGCGKTMLSPVIAALDRVELLTYAYELEYICALYHLNKIKTDAAHGMVKLLTDLQLYNTMMSREINFRPSDLSSALRDINPLRYIMRLFQEGDAAIPDRIRKERPILHLTTHNLLGYSQPVFAALQKRVVFVEVVRHPLHMLKQQALNMEHLVADLRDFTVYFDCCGKALPFFVAGWEEQFLKANHVEKAIYAMAFLSQKTESLKVELKNSGNVLTIPFEHFVIDPEPHLKSIAAVLGSEITLWTRKMLKKQNVPRKMYSQGIRLKIYERCGWRPPVSRSEEEEFCIRRRYAVEYASVEAVKILDQLCMDYEEKYLGGKKGYYSS